MSVYVVVDTAGAEVVRWVGEAAAVTPLLDDGADGPYVMLWADGVMVQRNQLGARDPASLRYVEKTDAVP